jgi:hypothetical protein
LIFIQVHFRLESLNPICYLVTKIPRDNIATGATMKATELVGVERVQLGVRMEKSMVKVLKGLAEFNGETLGELLEKIVLHSFEPVKGQEGEASASAHSKTELKAIADLGRVYGMDHEVHATRQFERDAASSSPKAGGPARSRQSN